ncbi:MAG: CAP domain-containing protein [Negativicutes bacterium]|nr:CAP domain-containing protein [Negativicutes bacterium]
MKSKFSVKIIMSLLIFSLIATSFGGAFTAAAYAASPEEEGTSIESGGKIDNAIAGGLLAIGLFAVLKGGKSGGKSPAPATAAPDQAAPAPAPAAPTPPANQTVQTTKPIIIAAGTQPAAPAQPAPAPSGSYSGLTADEQKAVSLLNADRALNGLPALKVNPNLVLLARNYAQDMINRDYFSHYNPEGQSPFDRMRQYGIRYSYAGENLAINRSVEAAEIAFMNSPGHRANILNPNYTEVGIGVRYDGPSVYVVQEFIRP